MPLIDLSNKEVAKFKLSAWHENYASSCSKRLFDWIQTNNQFKSTSYINKSDLFDVEMPKVGCWVSDKIFILEAPISPSKERSWATPDASGSNEGESLKSWCDRCEKFKKNGRGFGMPLAIMVKAFEQAPTLQEKSNLAWLIPNLASSTKLRVNPYWVEWLMGFPLGWSRTII